MSKIELDEYDKAILNILQEDASISNIDLSKKVGLAQSSCLMRTKKLKESNIIKQATILLDEKELGFGITAFAKVEISPHNHDTNAHFIEAINQLENVVECYTISGNGSFLIKIVAKTIDDYRDFVIDTIMGINAVANVESTLIMGVEKKTTHIPL